VHTLGAVLERCSRVCVLYQHHQHLAVGWASSNGCTHQWDNGPSSIGRTTRRAACLCWPVLWRDFRLDRSFLWATFKCAHSLAPLQLISAIERFRWARDLKEVSSHVPASNFTP